MSGMKNFIIYPSKVHGCITVPASKSQTLRAILFASLAKGKSTISEYLDSPDTEAMIKACRLFGARINQDPRHIEIEGLNGSIANIKTSIDAGNSGIVLRFCSAIGALAASPVVITGDHSIQNQRPMKPLLEGLRQLGVKAVSMRGNGYAPVMIQGPLHPGSATLLGHDSQPVSALLIASAFTSGPSEINVLEPGEKPWVGLTLDWFDRLGVAYTNHDFQRYALKGGARYSGFAYTVPGDLSTAAYPIAAALITRSELIIRNVDMQDAQGDKRLIRIFQEMGANIEIDGTAKTIYVKKQSSLSGIRVDVNDFIDGITILAAVACFAEGETHIYNGAIAKQKECNRIHCIATELKKMGADITETEDGLIIRKSILKGASLQTYGDHRMALSLAVAALGAAGESKIHYTECIAKTYNAFVNDFNALGAHIEVAP